MFGKDSLVDMAGSSDSAVSPALPNAAPSRVALLKTSPERVAADVQRAMEMAEWRSFITPGADVALKVNLGWDKLIPGSISAPWVVEGVIRTLRDYVNRIYLVDSSQVVVDVEKALRVSRLDRVCSAYRVEWVNLSQGRFVRIRDESHLVLKDVMIPEILLQTQVITVPLMKTHNKSVITGAIKNQWGCLRELRHNYHLVLSEALVDVNRIVKPRFAVMDGTIALEGNGPKSGIPKEMSLLLASSDLVALDAVAAEIMGFDPTRIEHLALCARHGLGTNDPQNIKVLGESPVSVKTRFTPARHNPVSWLELALRKSAVRRLIFETPLLRLFCWGARRYYDAWDWAVGRKHRRRLFASSGYAKQWS
jgi:uncharacterized protein (DUF362 family)